MIEQAGEEAGISGIVDVELVEKEQTAVLSNVVDRALDCIAFVSVIVDAAVYFVEESMEMQARLPGQWEFRIEGVSEPGLAPPCVAVDVEAARGGSTQWAPVEVCPESR
ncbi:hypothetical protein GCM10010459_01370 [Microbacterium schleiferi]|jgi:hypothetical protein